MKALTILAVALLAGVVGIGGCSSDGQTPGRCAGATLSAPKNHRPADAACPSTAANSSAFPDGGLSCTSDSECSADGGFGPPKCLHGTCSVDQCSVDSDCPSGSGCGCANSYYGGNGLHANACFTSTCRVDSDCGTGGYCSPSFGAYCGGLTGFYCHGPVDTCVNDSDCSCASSHGGTCSYQPTVGHWQCDATVVCTG